MDTGYSSGTQDFLQEFLSQTYTWAEAESKSTGNNLPSVDSIACSYTLLTRNQRKQNLPRFPEKLRFVGVSSNWPLKTPHFTNQTRHSLDFGCLVRCMEWGIKLRKSKGFFMKTRAFMKPNPTMHLIKFITYLHHGEVPSWGLSPLKHVSARMGSWYNVLRCFETLLDTVDCSFHVNSYILW